MSVPLDLPGGARLRGLRTQWVNALLGAFVVAGAVVAYVTVGPPKAATAAPRTATAARGVVLSSVSATGTIEPANQLTVNFQSGGTLTAVRVKPGQHVAAGQMLARVDPTSAKLTVKSDEANLKSARAQLQQTLAGETPQQRAQDAIAVQQASQSVQSAKSSLGDQKRTAALDKTALANAVSQAKRQFATDHGKEERDVYQRQQDEAQQATDQAAYDQATAAVNADQAQVDADKAQQQADQQAQYDVSATQTSDSTTLSQAKSNLSSAQSQLSSDESQESKDCGSSPPSSNCSADQTKVANDKTTVSNYQTAVDNAQAAVNNDNASSSSYQKKLSTDSYQLASDQSKLSTDQSTQNTAKSNLDADKSAVKSDQSAIIGDEQALAKDREAITNAEQSQKSGILKDQQSLRSATNAVSSAVLSKRSTKAANAVKQAPPLPGTIAQSEASVAQAEVALANARKTLAETTLRAPMAGTISTVNGIIGEQVGSGGSSSASTSSSSSTGSSGSSSSSSSSGFISLTQLTGMEVVAGFSETDAAKLAPGQPATVTVDALPGQELAAHVVEIDTNATVASNVVTYNVTFALDRSAAKLRPGMTANVDVIVSERDNVVHVPAAALRGSGTNATVVVLRNGKQSTVQVVAGLSGDTSTEIVSGLKAGATVVLPSISISSITSSGTGGTTGGGTLVGGGGGGGGFRGFGGRGG